MIINNKSQAANIKFSYYLTVFIYLTTVVLMLYFELLDNYLYLGVLTIIFIAVIIFSLLLKLNFIIYSDTGDNLILRYYPLHPFHEKFQSIEIPKFEFSSFEIKKGVFRLRTEIILYQKTSRGMAKYPPVSITSLKKKDRQEMLESLRKYTKQVK